MNQFIEKINVTRKGEHFTLVNSNEMYCHICDHETAYEKLVDKVWDISPTLGQPEYNGKSYKYSTDQKLKPLVYVYYSNNDAICYLVSQDFIMFYKLACEIKEDTIIAYYRITENTDREDVVIIDNNDYYIKTSYLKDYLGKTNKSLLYNIDIDIRDYKYIDDLITTLEQKGIIVSNNYPVLNCRFIFPLE